MKPITFVCRETLPLLPDEIVDQILNLANWPEFQGYGPIPGIKSAEFAVRTPGVVGTRIQVTSRDGSTHVEEIVEWQPARRLVLRMGEFSAPLSRLATEFRETWEFQREGDHTRVARWFELQPRSRLTWPLLWVISGFLRRAIDRQMRQMKHRS